MRTVFQAELQQVGEDLTEIARLVQTAFREASASLLDGDVERAEEVISHDARIDLLRDQLDERSIDLLALQNPVASDLRMVVGALRMSASLERMGDLARHLAQITRLRHPDRAVPDDLEETFREMSRLDLEIIAAVIALLTTRDLAQTDVVHRAKARINELHAELFTRIAAAEWSSDAQTTIDTTLLSRYMERFGDHGVSVARKVGYLVTGDWMASGNQQEPPTP